MVILLVQVVPLGISTSNLPRDWVPLPTGRHTTR